MSSEKSLRTFFTKTQRSASPQEHKHLQALGHLNRALASAQDLDKKDRVKTPEDASPEDPDKLLPTESYESMDEKFQGAHKFSYPAVFKPSPQTDARSYRELHKRSFTARHLSKVGNTFQANLRPSDVSQETEIGGGYTINKKNRASYDEPVISMIDALMRVHLLLLSFVRVSFIAGRARWPCTTSLGASAVDQEGEGIGSANSSGVPVWCSTSRKSLLKHLKGIEAYLR